MSYSGAIYQLIDKQRIDGEEILNVYFYANSGTSSPGEVSDLFIAEMIPEIIDIQGVDLMHEILVTRNILDLEADTVTVVDAAGSVAEEAFPSVVAAAYTLRPSSRTIRPGSKRYCGIPESFSNHNVWNAVGALIDFEGLRVKLSDALVGIASSYTPCVVKRIPYTTPGGNPAYRLPATEAEANISEVITALFDINVSHQVSRGN